MMHSRIFIDTDFDNGTPFINVEISKISSDIRDKMLRMFQSKFGTRSSWCRVEFIGDILKIYPIRPDEMNKEAALMLGATSMSNPIQSE